MNTHFLTEEELRRRCPDAGGTLVLAPNERLTPAAGEYVSGLRIAVTRSTTPVGAKAAPAACPAAAPAPAPARGVRQVEQPCAMTWLDDKTQVSKTHARIVFRGKLDSLLAATVLTQTQFDPKDRLPGILKECLEDVRLWIMQVLSAEVGGGAMDIKGMHGLTMDTLHAASREPQKYLGMDHCMADATQGGNVALVNWLRALTREAEIEALRARPADASLCQALNRLSSALYVLMLLTMAAQKGMPLSLFRG